MLKERFNAQAGKADTLDELVIPALILFFRSLGGKGKGGEEHGPRT